jgi:hypothetical protein
MNRNGFIRRWCTSTIKQLNGLPEESIFDREEAD